MLLSEFSLFVLTSLVLTKLVSFLSLFWDQINDYFCSLLYTFIDWFYCIYNSFYDIKTWIESNCKSRLCEIVLLVSIFVLVAIYLDDWFGISACFPGCSTSREFQFGYRKSNGPAVWKEHYECALGIMQSPINIVVNDTIQIKRGPLKWHYHREEPQCMTMFNDGYSVTVTGVWECGNKPQITGESLGNTIYEFNRIYFHWGPTDTEGSEHTLDYERFPLELHLIYLKEGYNTPLEVHYDQCSNGILIVAFLFEITPVDNPGFLETITENLHKVKKPKMKCQIEPFALSDIYPEFQYCYYKYDGSISQPPCSEIVTYIIQAETIAVSKRQMSLFRKLIAFDGKTMMNNSRPVQKLNGRSVYFCSFSDC